MKYLVFLFAFYSSFQLIAQNPKSTPPNPPAVINPPASPKGPVVAPAPAPPNEKEIYLQQHAINTNSEDDKIFSEVQVAPEFPGGIDEMYKFIANNLVYPESARTQKAEGKVIVQFVVEKNGSLNLINIIRDGVGHGAGEEARRVLNAMPKWKPGTENNKPVRTQYTLPFSFKLKK